MTHKLAARSWWGTSSGAAKCRLATSPCLWSAHQRIGVAPFKTQNMGAICVEL